MQKVIQRSQLAKRNADRRLQKLAEHHEKGQGWSRRNEAQRLRQFNHSLIKTAREARKEDWARGALAPRRDVGDLATTYGSVGMFNMSVAERQEKNKPKWRSIIEGDRVVVLKGREKGKIAVVTNYDNDRGVVKLDGINMGDVNVPEWAQQESNSEETMMAVAFPIAVEDVRLVYPLLDPETGIPRDVVIDRLERVNEQWDPVAREWDDGERAMFLRSDDESAADDVGDGAVGAAAEALAALLEAFTSPSSIRTASPRGGPSFVVSSFLAVSSSPGPLILSNPNPKFT